MSRTALLGVIAAFFMGTHAEAATRVWVGGQPNNLWSNGVNWQGGVAPANGDRVVFSASGGGAVTFNDFPAIQLEALEINSDAAYVFRGNPVALIADTGLVIRSSAQPITFEARLSLLSKQPRIAVNAPTGGVPPTIDFNEMTVRGTLVVAAPGATLNFLAGVTPVFATPGLDITAEVVRFHGANLYPNDVNITARRFVAAGEALARAKSVTYVRPGSGLLEFTSPRPSEEQRYDLRGTAPGSGLRLFDPVIDEVFVEGTQVIDAAQPLSLPGLLWGPGRLVLAGGNMVTISGTDNLITGGLEVRDAFVRLGAAQVIPPVNDLVLNGPTAVFEVGVFPLKVRNFSCNNGAIIRWVPSAIPLEITGTIDVTGCLLDFGDMSGAPGPTVQEVTLLQNNSGAAIVGELDATPEGLRVMLAGVERFVTYRGGGSHGDLAFTSAFNLGRVEGGGTRLSAPVGVSIDLQFTARILDAMKNPRPGAAARATISPAGCGRFANGAETVGLVADAQGFVTAPAFTGVAYNHNCSVTLAPVSGGGAASVTVAVYEPASLRLTFLSDYALASMTAAKDYDVIAVAGGFHGIYVPQLPVTWSVQSSGPASAVATALAPKTGAFGLATVRLQPNGVAGAYDLVAQVPGASHALHITQVASVAARARTSSTDPSPNTVTLMDGGAGCTLNAVDFDAPAPAGSAPGWVFPRGFVRVSASGCTPGARLHFRSVDTAQPRNPDGAFLRYGVAPGESAARWHVLQGGAFDDNDPFAYTFALTDGEFEDVVFRDGTLTATVAYAVPVTSYQDMWWAGSAENGWGLSLVQHRDTVFAVIYAYDNAGKPIWYVMPGGSWNKEHTTYSGSLYLPHGTPFFAYDAAALVPGSPVGTATLTVLDADHAVLSYTINGVSGSKSITRQSYGDAKAFQPVRGDMWWGGLSQNGWGIASVAQGAKLFSVWFTYDAAGAPTWFVMPDGSFSDGRRRYDGKLYRTTGSAWLGQNYNASQLQVIEVGTFRFDFSADTARFQYANEGRSGTLQLERQPF